MIIDFYKLISQKKNALEKQLPDSYIKINGEFRDAVEISNPTIIIDISSTSDIHANGTQEEQQQLINNFRNNVFNAFDYVYIPSVRRYYFVKRIILLRKNIVSIDLHVDVLKSFTRFIYSQNAFVSRNETNYNKSLPDERRIVTNETEMIIYQPTQTPTGNLKNITFNVDIQNNPYCVVVNAVKGDLTIIPYTKAGMENIASSSYNTGQIQQGDGLPTNISLGNILNVASSNIVTLTGLADILLDIFNDNNVTTFVNNIFVYPYEITDYRGTASSFMIASKQIKDSQRNDIPVKDGYYFSKKMILSDFTISEQDITDFNILEPYSKYEIFLPFYGWTTLPFNRLIGKRILIYYTVCYANGTSMVNIYNYTDKAVIFSSSCNLGVEIPKNTSNYQQVIDRHFANNLNLGIGAGLGFLGLGQHYASGKTDKMVGDVGGVVKSIGSYIINERTNYNQAQIQNATSDDFIFQPLEVYIRRITSLIHYQLTNAFLQENGGVINELYYLWNLRQTGYTEIADIPNISYENINNIPTDTEVDEIMSLLKSGVIL